MLELGKGSKKYHEQLSKVINNLIDKKYSLKEKKQFSHINILVKIKEGIFCNIMRILTLV